MKLKFAIIIFLIIPFFGVTQKFELKKPNITELSGELMKTKYSQNVKLYLFQKTILRKDKTTNNTV